MDKKVMYIFMSIGAGMGGYLPMLFGADGLSGWAILGSGVGAIVGIFFASKISA